MDRGSQNSEYAGEGVPGGSACLCDRGKLRTGAQRMPRKGWAKVEEGGQWWALFRCARPSGVPRGPATSTGSLASQRHPGKFPIKGERHQPRDDRSAAAHLTHTTQQSPSLDIKNNSKNGMPSLSVRRKECKPCTVFTRAKMVSLHVLDIIQNMYPLYKAIINN